VVDPTQAEIDQETHRTGSKLRGPFRTAADLYSFVRVHAIGRRYPTPDAKAAHDWAVVTFLLATQGARLPTGGLTSDNATTVPVPHR
jgi:hypothetical protein